MDALPIPLTQSEAFEKTCRVLGVEVMRFSTAAGTCLVQSRRLPLIGRINLVSRGPVARDKSRVADLLSEVQNSVRGPLFVNAASAAKVEGGVKLVEGAELAMVSLSSTQAMKSRLHQKWRNQLRKAERSDLKVICQPLNAADHKWFLDAEMEQQRARRYRSYPTQFLLAYAAANKGDAQVYSAFKDGEPVAAMLMLRHGPMATYQAGVTTAAGRAHCAHNLLLWNMMCGLHKEGGTILDLGRTDLSPGLRRFKLGTGAMTEQLAGTYWMPFWAARRPRPSEAVKATA